jgi:sulfur-carrier protein adenylyltransferase/sulfurtransferase
MPSLTPAEIARYRRHLSLPEIGVPGQLRLRDARVLVVGAGGLGSPALLYLAAAGIGTLGLADLDFVEPSNLQRQILHDDVSVGTPKVASAATRLRALNPLINVVPHPEGVTAANALALFATYDVIVDGTDNFATRYLNNDAAFLARRPLVHGSVFKFEGQVTVLAPHLGGPCLRCLFPAPPAEGLVPNCAEAGVLGALCGVIGSLQALEVIKLLTGIGEPLIGRLLIYDALTSRFETLTLPRDPACILCGDHPILTHLDPTRFYSNCATPTGCIPPTPTAMSDSAVPLEISVQETHRLLTTTPGEVLLIDVREPHEVDRCAIAGATPIPLRQIPEYLADFPADKHLLIHCHHGGRSLRVTEFLRRRGFPRVSNVSGGIEAWALEIELGMARY